MPLTKDLLFLVLFDVTKQMQKEMNINKIPDHPNKLSDDDRAALMRICELLVERDVIENSGKTNSGLNKAFEDAKAKYEINS